MSIEAVSAVLDGVHGISSGARSVLLVLAEHARRGSWLAWPSVATIARRTDLDRRTAQRRLRELAGAGWLAIERASHGGRSKTTVYRLNVERMRAAIADRNSGAHAAVSDEETAAHTPPFAGPKQRRFEHKTAAFRACYSGVSSTQTAASTPPEPVLNLHKNRVEPARANVDASSTESQTRVLKNTEDQKPEPKDPTRFAKLRETLGWSQPRLSKEAEDLPIPPVVDTAVPINGREAIYGPLVATTKKPLTVTGNEYERAKARQAKQAERNARAKAKRDGLH